MSEQQTYKTHVRWDPVWHFFIAPLLLLNIIFAVVAMIRHWPDHPHLFPWAILMSIVIFMAVGKARGHSLKAQDRIIRLEERLRIAALVSGDDLQGSKLLTESQLIGLRFASDDELPVLVHRTLAENLSQKEIKAAIVKWRPDTFRV